MSVWLLFEIAVNIYQSFLMIYFVRRRFHLAKPQIRYAILPCIAISSALSVYLFTDVPFLDTFVFFVPLIYTWFASDDIQTPDGIRIPGALINYTGFDIIK